MSTGRAVGRCACAAGLLLAAAILVFLALPVEAQQAAKEPAYRAFPVLGSRLAVWAVAQLHLNFAAFILGVPIFAVIIKLQNNFHHRPTPRPQPLRTSAI